MYESSPNASCGAGDVPGASSIDVMRPIRFSFGAVYRRICSSIYDSLWLVAGHQRDYLFEFRNVAFSSRDCMNGREIRSIPN